ncbi:MAG: allophanate hydrolase subunit 1 [Pseudomonadota bacterium]
MSAPVIRTAGFDGFVVTFGERLTDAANSAALAFRSALEDARPDGLLETSTSLVSTYLRFDPLTTPHGEMKARMETLLAGRDWLAAPLPPGRTLWRVPVAFGGAAGPQLAEAADLAGLSEDAAIASLTEARTRVLTIGFAPGMPYLGQLPAAWDIPRQTNLTAEVPLGGLCVAIRQLVLFPNATPTGWRHIGQTRLRLFRPEADAPFVLKPGDEVALEPVSPAALDAIGDDPGGGAIAEPLP